ncbi:ABC transporter permease [Tundrisphaera lichenicola]|uniref:ABC transporter permease n=1 Tax=Tundrisphaera lichenicola TaxID=2029860 RepID=UPI003EBD5D50
MSWIALKMLTGDRAKFFGIVMGLTFAALLITQQGSIFCGLMLRTGSLISDTTGADLWVMDPNVLQVDDNKPMIENNLYRVRGVEGVLWAVPFYKGNARAKVSNTDPLVVGKPRPEGAPDPSKVIEQVILLGLDDASMVGAPPPERILFGRLEDLRKPESIFVDHTRLAKLFPGYPPEYYKKENAGYFLGKEVEMNDHRAIIVGICEASRTFQSNPVVYTTYSRAKGYVAQERKVLSYILAKIDEKPGLTEEQRTARRIEVADAVRRQTGLMALTSQQFLDKTINYYLKYTGIPINFGITAFLGFLVGTAIAGQTFYNFTLENLKQFGALKAMGATNGRIVGMILLQALVVGFLGYGIGVGLAALFGERTKGGELAFYTPWQLLPITGVAVVLICILASLISVRKVIVLEPAVVFRG